MTLNLQSLQLHQCYGPNSLLYTHKNRGKFSELFVIHSLNVIDASDDLTYELNNTLKQKGLLNHSIYV